MRTSRAGFSIALLLVIGAAIVTMLIAGTAVQQSASTAREREHAFDGERAGSAARSAVAEVTDDFVLQANSTAAAADPSSARQRILAMPPDSDLELTLAPGRTRAALADSGLQVRDVLIRVHLFRRNAQAGSETSVQELLLRPYRRCACCTNLAYAPVVVDSGVVDIEGSAVTARGSLKVDRAYFVRKPISIVQVSRTPQISLIDVSPVPLVAALERGAQ